MKKLNLTKGAIDFRREDKDLLIMNPVTINFKYLVV